MIMCCRSLWPNRDPLGELGFGTIRHRLPNVIARWPNLYSYVRNNPGNAVDPNGLVDCDELKTTINQLEKIIDIEDSQGKDTSDDEAELERLKSILSRFCNPPPPPVPPIPKPCPINIPPYCPDTWNCKINAPPDPFAPQPPPSVCVYVLVGGVIIVYCWSRLPVKAW